MKQNKTARGGTYMCMLPRSGIGNATVRANPIPLLNKRVLSSPRSPPPKTPLTPPEEPSTTKEKINKHDRPPLLEVIRAADQAASTDD